MSRWGSILGAIFNYGSVAVAIAEATGLSGKQKAIVALDHVADAIGLADLEESDPSAASVVRRGIKRVNDGIVDVQNAVGGLSGKPPEKVGSVAKEAAPESEDPPDEDSPGRVAVATAAAEKASRAAEEAAQAATSAADSAERAAKVAEQALAAVRSAGKKKK